jgi:DNA helicase HerA-like ATPase
LDTYADPMGQLIADLYERVVVEGYQSADGRHIQPKQHYSIDDLLKCLADCVAVQHGYHQDTLRAVATRFKSIRRQGVFSDMGIDIREMLVPGQISILLLRDIEHSLRSLLVGVLVKKVMQLRSASDKFERLAIAQKGRYQTFREKGNEEEANEAYAAYRKYEEEAQKGLPRGWIVVDEAHNYMPAKGITPSADPLKKYVTEGRNLGLSIVMATQNPSALEQSIRRNTDVLIIHSISMRDDISAVDGMVNTFVPDAFEFGRQKITSKVLEQLVRSLRPGYAVISNSETSRAFVAKMRPRITVHGGTDY